MNTTIMTEEIQRFQMLIQDLTLSIIAPYHTSTADFGALMMEIDTRHNANMNMVDKIGEMLKKTPGLSKYIMTEDDVMQFLNERKIISA